MTQVLAGVPCRSLHPPLHELWTVATDQNLPIRGTLSDKFMDSHLQATESIGRVTQKVLSKSVSKQHLLALFLIVSPISSSLNHKILPKP